MSKETKVRKSEDVGGRAYDMFVENILQGCDNPEESMAIIRQAAEKIYTNLCLDFKNEAGYIYLATLFYSTWHNVLDFLESKVKNYTDYKLDIAGLIEVGFCNGQDDDESEQGNFVPTIEHKSSKVPLTLKEDEKSQVSPSVEFNSRMITQNPDAIRVIAEKVREFFDKECDLLLPSSETVFPIFGYIYNSLVVYVTLRRKELDEFNYKIDFLNCFNIIAMFAQDGGTEIGFEPKQMQKLSIKSDAHATSVNE